MSLSALENWYAGQCNGVWEHGCGVRIDTLDNPGWRPHRIAWNEKTGCGIAKGRTDLESRRLDILLGREGGISSCLRTQEPVRSDC